MALVALIAYGVFMTSIMFPSHHFESWNTLLFMLIRPYLLLFAETGIDEYECMYQEYVNNIFPLCQRYLIHG